MIEIVLTVVMALGIGAGLVFELIRFARGDQALTTADQVAAAVKRDRIAIICFLVGALAGFLAGHFLVSIFAVFFGIIMNDSPKALARKAKVTKKERKKAAKARETTADQVAIAMGVSPDHLAGIDPDILAEIERAMEEAKKDGTPETMTTEEQEAYWRRMARVFEAQAKDGRS